MRLVVLERRTLFRQGLAALLENEPDIEVLGAAGDAAEARRLCTRTLPDLILLDESLVEPCLEQEQTLFSLLSTSSGGASIVVLGRAGDTADADCAETEGARARGEGAAAYLCATMDKTEMLRTIRAVWRAKMNAGTPHDSASLPGRDVATTLHPLTERERTVVALIIEGLCNKEIAQRLGISTQTVKNHVSHLLEKLSLADRTQLAVYAMERKL
jgi:NarL family two-component system response regulator LiaR